MSTFTFSSFSYAEHEYSCPIVLYEEQQNIDEILNSSPCKDGDLLIVTFTYLSLSNPSILDEMYLYVSSYCDIERNILRRDENGLTSLYCTLDFVTARIMPNSR